ncbi:helix-turn-helix transcriptional regulator [Idiomarina xiamenensis]|uniref:DeoR family transcriptional regulator n=1 Tax=Idiomarina xiamenensis 10-D-4 TaxID=740709 RepID=K2KLM8_9GAMM|nr:YafY family protein [Idiomarina xiamenensis]EKE83429.1 DeoR family transcriptional regulator [Idiomarina xiamenensis 10-D-4]
MSKPTTRLLTLLELLQSHDQLSGNAIAQQLAVDRRTVRRYVSQLEELGIPIMTEQGRYGGYKLVAGFKLPPMMFTAEETLALALGLIATKSLRLTGESAAIHSVQAKLERVMPAPVKQRLQTVSSRIEVMASEAMTAPAADVLLPMMEAIQQQRRVRMTYQAEQQAAVSREFDPYGMFFQRGYWYVGGFCRLRGALRTFRLDRLTQLQTLNTEFARPPDYHAAEHFRQSLTAMPGNTAVSLLLHTDLATASKVLSQHSQCTIEQQHDALLLNTKVDCLQWFAWWLARLPFAFTVLTPNALKQTLRQRANELLRACGD